ncbi:MAG: sugar phosphate isomerase/epimerase family protein [Pseudoxanthomonas sp.]
MPSPRLTGPRFLNTVLLGGSTPAKLTAAARAGFAQVELWQQDMDGCSQDEMLRILSDGSLALTDVQVLLDFDGASDGTRVGKYHEAEQLLVLAGQLGAPAVLVPANTASDCDAQKVMRDLRWLCRRADQIGLRVAYEGMAWSRFNSTIPSAWRQIEEVGAGNLDLVVDAFHLFAAGRQLDDLRGVPVERIALVQLSDAVSQPLAGQVKQQARHQRCLPGQGIWPLGELVQALAQMGYRGPVGLEVFNDDLKARDPDQVAREAWQRLDALLRGAGTG